TRQRCVEEGPEAALKDHPRPGQASKLTDKQAAHIIATACSDAIGRLTERFHIEKVRARDTWHLANRFIRKLLANTIGCFLGKLLGNPALLFETLVEI
ncbi:MAG: helix-turn-helix domain-containing protein, partial [Methylovulum miyakonense]|uniref:helix-turn-helix domain-containing protein n=1 Tax=Methylovulum miyakonense TaxID=645578 RepID=UPI003BB657A9